MYTYSMVPFQWDKSEFVENSETHSVALDISSMWKKISRRMLNLPIKNLLKIWPNFI